MYQFSFQGVCFTRFALCQYIPVATSLHYFSVQTVFYWGKRYNNIFLVKQHSDSIRLLGVKGEFSKPLKCNNRLNQVKMSKTNIKRFQRYGSFVIHKFLFTILKTLFCYLNLKKNKSLLSSVILRKSHKHRDITCLCLYL